MEESSQVRPAEFAGAVGLDQGVDLTSEPMLAKCLQELAETKEQTIGLTEWNEQGKTRFHSSSDGTVLPAMADASQRLTELQGILKEAKKAELEEKLLEEVEAKLHEEAGAVGASVSSARVLHSHLLYLLLGVRFAGAWCSRTMPERCRLALIRSQTPPSHSRFLTPVQNMQTCL